MILNNPKYILKAIIKKKKKNTCQYLSIIYYFILYKILI